MPKVLSSLETAEREEDEEGGCVRLKSEGAREGARKEDEEGV